MLSVADAFWNNLLERIDNRSVVPVVGAGPPQEAAAVHGDSVKSLSKLARIAHFDIFIQLGNDARLESELNQQRFDGAARTQSVSFPSPHNDDLPVAEPAGKSSAVVLHLLSDPCAHAANVIRSIADAPPGVLRVLNDRSLLVFDRRSAQSRVLFLSRRKDAEQIVTNEGVDEFIDELSRRYFERHPAPTEPKLADAQDEMAPGALFLSYASEDLELVSSIKEQLERNGLHVWFDKAQLFAGEAYTNKIHRNIKNCSLFLPVISSNTQVRQIAYFRKEWRWASERAMEFSEKVPFLIPLVTDGISEGDANVPPEFLGKQWTSIVDGEVPPELIARLVTLVQEYYVRIKRPAPANLGRAMGAAGGGGPKPQVTLRRRTNLVPSWTRFVGRRREVERLRQILKSPDTRLVTLHGFGGAGKTRLAQHVASELVVAPRAQNERFDGGIWFVDLTNAPGIEEVWQAIAQVLTIAPRPGAKLKDDVLNFLAIRDALLLLDNCDAVQGLDRELPELLNRCPSVTCVITSRTVPVVAGEMVFEVNPLPLPSDAGSPPVECDSVVLFADRAKSAFSPFELNAQNLPYVVKLVERLDGLPLAIELAAARASMGPKVLLERINNLPTSPVEEGHEDTVSNLISWSFKILKDAEKQLLMQLSLFTGGFTPAAAGSVLGSADDAAARPVKDLPLQLDNLRRKSLLSCRQDSEDVRYSMLELIRTYCADEVVRTSSADHAAALRLRHARYFLGQMKELSARLYCDRGASMLMKDDLPNARSAMDWALSAGEDVLGAEVALALCPFFARHGYAAERFQRCMQGLAAARKSFTGSHALIAALLYQAGWCALDRADYPSAVRYLNESIASRDQLIAAAADDEALQTNRRGIAYARHLLSVALIRQGEVADGRKQAETALELMRACGDSRGISLILNNRGLDAKSSGAYVRAQELFDEALDQATTARDFATLAEVRNNLATVYERRGNLEKAEHLYTESMSSLRKAGRMLSVASCLSNLARIARLSGKLDEALSFARQALDIRKEFNDLDAISLSLVQISGILVTTWQAKAAGGAAMTRGLLEEAKDASEEALRIATDASYNRGIANAQLQLADVLMIRRQFDAAAPLYARAYVAAGKCMDDQIQVAVVISWSNCATAMDEELVAVKLLRLARRILWRSPTIQSIRRAAWTEAAPPTELRRLTEVLMELHRLLTRQGDRERMRSGFALYAAMRFSEGHGCAFPNLGEAYEKWAAHHTDLVERFKRRAARLRKRMAPGGAFDIPQFGKK